jgi:hypothetical protein
MLKLTVFAIIIVVASVLIVESASKSANLKDCDGVVCKEFCCDAGDQCCYDSWSGTHFCDKKCDIAKHGKFICPYKCKNQKNCDFNCVASFLQFLQY